MALTGFDPISLGIGAVGNIVSGIFGSRAANKAAKIQEQAAKGAAARIDQTTGQVNGDLIGAATATAGQLRQAAGEGIARNDEQVINANKLLNPYREAGDQAIGTLQEGLAAGGDFNKNPTMADIQIDPGFEFRRAQAQKALEGSAAAHGGALSGGGRDVLALNSGLASEEYRSAFERFRQSTGDRFSRLNTVAGQGQAAAGAQGGNLIEGGQFGAGLNYKAAVDAGNINFGAAQQAGQNSLQGARDVGELLTSGAAARAAGIVGGANALGGGIAGAANGVTGGLQLRNLLKNPSPAMIYSRNPLGGGYYGAGPQRPPP